MACFAHPDDAELWCGGTLIKCKKKGYQVHSVCCETQDPQRTLECVESAKIIGIDKLDFLAKKKNWWTFTDDDFKRMVGLIIANKPDVVVTHPHDDCHPEHRLFSDFVMKTCIVARDRISKDIELVAASSYNGLTLNGMFQPSIFVDVTAVWEKKIEAVNRYLTQVPAESIKLIDTQSLYFGHIVNTQRAEGFRPIPLVGYIPRQSLLYNL